ncbi:MAG: NAD(P)/FAD-dependent oxidoreductase [Spirochaetes bacterium]|nr:NAD(P)/FAD-dependent oxidoreductase [Spirochaetota bacterium]
MSKNKLPSDCDVIVIGAGIAGLTASALLTKSGLKVVTVEEQSKPGGYFMGFKRKGFTFDSSIQWLNQCKDGGFIYNVFNFIGNDYPRCNNMNRIRRYKGESFDYLLTCEPHILRDQLIKDFPDEAEGTFKFFKDCKIISRRFDILKNRMRAIETMTFFEKIFFGIKMLWWVIPIWKTLRISADKGLAKYFKGEPVKKIFCSEEKFMSIIMPICWAYERDFQSPPQGGAEVYINWLCKKIKGGLSQIILTAKVEKVLIEKKKAIGVTLANGHTIYSRYVIAACDVENLYERMLPAGTVPDKLLNRLREADLYYSSVTLFIGLACDASAIGLQEELTCITLDNITRKEHFTGNPYKSSLIVQVPSLRDKTLAPKGKSTLTIQCAAWIDYNNFWQTDKNLERGIAYKKFKQEFADILIARVEKVLHVKIKDHIEVLEIATPITYWRYTKNRNGSIMGASQTDKNIMNRLAHYYTPVKNLFLGGHWAEYGGGMPIAVKAASNVSLLILNEINKQEFKKLRDAMDGKNINNKI